MGKSRGNLHCAPSLLILHSWERLFADNARLWLDAWKRFIFTGDGFAGALSIDSTMLSIVHKRFSQMAPWFRTIRPAASRKLQRNFCFVSFVHTHSTSKSKSAYICLSRMRNASKHGFSKFWHKNFSYSRGKSETALGENRKDRVCLLLLFHEWQNLELLRGYPYFRNAILIFMIFRNKYVRAVMVGMYKSFHCRI